MGSRSEQTALGLRRAGRWFAAVAVLGGAVVLAGWSAGLLALARLHPDSIEMAPSTAVCAVVFGAAIWTGRGRLRATGAGLVALFAIVVVSRGVFGLTEELEDWLLRTAGFPFNAPDAMSPVTARCFVMAATGLLLAGVRGRHERAAREASNYLAVLVSGAGLTVLLGFLLGTPLQYTRSFLPVAFPTALAFCGIGLGILAEAGPGTRLMRALTGESTRSRLIRAFLPAVVVVNVLGSWAGMFIVRHTQANPAVVTALTTACEVAVILVVIYSIAAWVGGSLERAENALRESEERFRVIATQTPDHIIVQDKDLRYLWVVNPQLGLTVEGMIGRADHDILSREDADRLTELKEGVLESGQPVHVSLPLVSSQGDTQYFDGSYIPKHGADGKVDGLIGYFRNVTEIKKAEEALAFESSMRNLLLENLPCIAMILKRGTREIVYSNRMAREAGAFVGKTCFATCAGLDKPCPFCLAPEVWAADTPRRLEVEHGGRQYEGRWLPLTPDLYVHYIFDLTENKRAEEERQRLREQLAQAQKMESIGRLAGGVAHDFNNLLTVINGYSALLLHRLPAGAPERSAIGEIHQAGERAEGLVRQLLAFSRKQLLNPEVLDLNQVIAGLENMLIRLLGEDIQMVVQPGKSLLRTVVDRHQIEQVIMNLAVNARDAMPQGGTLTIRTGNVLPTYQVRLTVQDTGTGMDEETRRRLFEPFFTTKGVGVGTGLGLAMVHGIVEQSGGRIEVESELGRGTAFHIWFPAVEAEPAAGSESGKPTSPGGSETILLVEDQEDVRRYAASVLESCGYRVLEASGGKQALGRCEAERPDLLLTDIMMPGMGGLELAARAAAVHPAIRTMFMSGFSEDVHEREGRDLRGAKFLQKPFSPDALARGVREVLDRQPTTPRSAGESRG